MSIDQDFVAQILGQDLETVAKYVNIEDVRARYAQYSATEGSDEQESLYDIMTLAL